jgi:hypothetical protein
VDGLGAFEEGPTLVSKTIADFHQEAEFLRQSSGSTNIQNTLLKALRIFKLFGIPHYVCGGFAVQEHGYPRFTVDVDIIVPDVDLAREKLVMNGFRTNPSSKMTVTDCETKVEIDLLPEARRWIQDRSRFPCLLMFRTLPKS